MSFLSRHEIISLSRSRERIHVHLESKIHTPLVFLWKKKNDEIIVREIHMCQAKRFIIFT